MKEASPKTTFLKDYEPPAWLVDHVHLWFDLREQGTRVRSRLSMRRNPAADKASDLWLDGEGLKPVAFSLDGKPLAESAWSTDDNGVRIEAPPDEFVLETEVEIAPESNTALEGLYRSSEMFCTQCEAEGFRRITWYPDRPDVMARYTTTLVADKATYPVLLSNGNPVERGETDDGRKFLNGAVEIRDLPLPLLWQPNSMQGHDGAVIVGRIDHMVFIYMAERARGRDFIPYMSPTGGGGPECPAWDFRYWLRDID